MCVQITLTAETHKEPRPPCRLWRCCLPVLGVACSLSPVNDTCRMPRSGEPPHLHSGMLRSTKGYPSYSSIIQDKEDKHSELCGRISDHNTKRPLFGVNRKKKRLSSADRRMQFKIPSTLPQIHNFHFICKLLAESQNKCNAARDLETAEMGKIQRARSISELLLTMFCTG